MRTVFFVVLLMSIQLYGYNPHHAAKLLQAIKAGGLINVSGCDFRGCGSLLKGLNFSNAQFAKVLFDTISTNAMPQAHLIKIPGQKSDLTGCNFSGVCLVSTGFQGAILRGANFTGADIAYANFQGADLTGAIGLESALHVNLALFCGAIMPDGKVCSGNTCHCQ